MFKKIFWLLLAAVIINLAPFYRPLLFEDRALLFRDISRHYIVGKSIWAKAVAAGEGIPYWNYYSFGGMRFWAENVNAPLHPLNTLFLFFQPKNYPIAMSYYLWLHYIGIFLGAYFLLRVYRKRHLESILFASSLSLSGVCVSAHNLMHALTSFTSVPFFFGFWTLYLRERKLLHLLGASFCLAWPIYGGDPQFSYVLVCLALIQLIRAKNFLVKEKIFRFLQLGFLSFLAGGAQLFPTLEFVMDSGRGLGKLNNDELLLFSFHPIRLFETIWPQFFGNRFGPEAFWGETFINFPYKTPFIFSTFPGVLVVSSFLISLFLLPRMIQKRRKRLLLWLCFPLGMLLCFGVFSPLPIYSFFLDWFPLFRSFRYPERLLFWPFFAIWFYAASNFSYYLRFLSQSKCAKWFYWGPILYLFISFFYCALILFNIMDYPESSVHAAAKSGFFLSIFLFLAYGIQKKYIRYRTGLVLFLVVQFFELSLIQTNIVWDQSKNIMDPQRYPLARELLQESESAKFKTGHARRFSFLELSPYQFIPGMMDHTSFTTFAAFEALASNISGYIGVEDYSGYFALTVKEKTTYWMAMQKAAGGANSLIYNLGGVYFVPSRDENQNIVLHRNEDALSYLFIPNKIIQENGFDASLKRVADKNFDYKSTAVVSGSGPAQSQNGTRLGFTINKRTGRTFQFDFSSQENSNARTILWNESFDRHWTAYVNEKPVTVKLANAWAMAIEIPSMLKNETINIRFEYWNPLIPVGICATIFWFLLLLYHLAISRKRKRTLC